MSTLPPGAIAYVDGDWLPVASQPLPSLTITADGNQSWSGGPAISELGGSDPDLTAARTLLAVAREAAEAVSGFPPRSVEITGHGLIARQIEALARESIGERPRDPVERPHAIVDATGRADSIAAATRRVQDLGTVVLVGVTDGPVDLDLYPDVHMRGLTVVGVGLPLQPSEAGAALGESDGPLLEWSQEALVRAISGIAVPAGAVWFRLER